MLVGNDGQGFQRRQGEPERWFEAFGEEPYGIVALRLGRHAIATGNLANFNAAAVGGTRGDQLID